MATNHIFLKTVALLGSMCTLLAASPTWSQSAPELGKIEFENDMLIVVRIHMAPHERTPMHDIVSPRLVVWLTDAHLKDTGPDGSVSEYSRSAGASEWATPRRHMGENLSDQGLDFLAIIPKIASAPAAHGVAPH